MSFERWTRGDTRAIDDLVRTMTPVLWQVVRAYGLDPLLAEDVVQATWLTLVRRRAAIRDPQAIAG
ncbi:RNA polymerase sigma factor, partial [Streptomyces caniscabiei]|uniref:RNA polymerase sigma factor n=1 Tax=Streptomyces caniscabiei TaxID=2746961 RepID=UPI0038F7223D